jgi:hypothetical protein
MDAGFQDIAVTLVALSAAVSIVWRVAGLVRPQPRAKPGCSGCASCPPARRDAPVTIARQPPG